MYFTKFEEYDAAKEELEGTKEMLIVNQQDAHASFLQSLIDQERETTDARLLGQEARLQDSMMWTGNQLTQAGTWTKWALSKQEARLRRKAT